MIYKLLLKLLGWKVVRNISKHSVIAMFPHTSYWDGIIGFLVMRSMKLNYKVMSAEWLFFWPFKYVMRYLLHAFPVGPKSSNAITKSVNLLKQEKCNLIICPEGQLAATDKWNMGFYIIAKKANVGIDLVVFNYNIKTINIFSYPAYNLPDGKTILKEINSISKRFAYPKYVEKFKLSKV